MGNRGTTALVIDNNGAQKDAVLPADGLSIPGTRFVADPLGRDLHN